MAFNADEYLAELAGGGKRRKGSCNNRRKKKSCKSSGCVWSKRSKSGAKAHCRNSPKGSRKKSTGKKASRRSSGRKVSLRKMGKSIMGCAKKMYRKMSKAQKNKKGAWQNCVKVSAKKCKRNGYKC